MAHLIALASAEIRYAQDSSTYRSGTRRKGPGVEVLAQRDIEEVCGLDPELLCKWVYEVTGNTGLAEFADWFLTKPAKVLLIVVIAIVAVRIVRRLIARSVGRVITGVTNDDDSAGRLEDLADRALGRTGRTDIEKQRAVQRLDTLRSVLSSLATVAIYTIALLIILGEFNIDLGPLVASAGIAGIAIGFGAQTLVKDFLSGIFMLIEDQFGVGDVIDIGEATGTVESVSLRVTRLRDVEGTVWFVPNGEVRRIGNKSQAWARTVMDVEVAYDTDIAVASEVIKRAADTVWHDHVPDATILEEPEIWGVQNFGADAIAIRLAVVTEPGEQFNVGRAIRGRLKVAFDEHGIEIPFPQRTVWLHDMSDGSAPVDAT